MTVQPLKNKFPFRLGTTSFIRPAGYADNVAFVGPLVDDVELLFFESEERSLPQMQEVKRLRQLKTEQGISYTLHLPLDLHPGSAAEARREKSMGSCRRLVAATGKLEPLAWILHVPAWGQGAEWLPDAMERSIKALEEEGLDRSRLCLETLDYPCAQVWAMAETHDLSMCIDIGHLLLYGFPVVTCLDACLKRCRVIHLHGIQRGKDHREISFLDPNLREKILSRLMVWGKGDKVVTLEVFGHDALLASLATMREHLR
jgi:sugar phosphate isomerase/epimerase